MSHNNFGGNYLNKMNKVNINANIMNKFNKINHQNFKTIITHNSNATNYRKYSHSKDNIQLTNITLEKKKNNSNSKKLNDKKDKKNYIPKIKTDIINDQLVTTNNNDRNFNGYNINLKTKKEYHPRHNSSSHQKSNNLYDKNSKEINILRKKILTSNNNTNSNINNSNTNISNSSKHIPRSNERLTSSDNNNSGKKFVKRSNTNSNINELYNNDFFFNEIIKYKNIIKILLYYIENLNKKIKYYLNKNQIEKNNKIKELSLQNKFLLNENKALKMKIIQFIYIMKIFIKNDKKLFNEKYYKIIKDLIIENKFLRKINILPKNINNSYLSELRKQIQVERMKKELIIQNQITNRNNNINNNNLDNQNSNKDMNNPFNHSESSQNIIDNIVSHKRQRTHFNLGKLNDENNNSNNNSNRNSISSSYNISNEQSSQSTNTVVENKDKEFIINKNENIFSETLREMNNNNKTLKKMNNNSKKNLLENNNENKFNDLNNKNVNENNSNNTNVNNVIKINRLINKVINNIPYNTNKNEHINIQNDRGDNRKIIKKNLNQKNDLRNNDYNNTLIENEKYGNKKQQSIYYRATKEKEKKKIIFLK